MSDRYDMLLVTSSTVSSAITNTSARLAVSRPAVSGTARLNPSRFHMRSRTMVRQSGLWRKISEESIIVIVQEKNDAVKNFL